MNRAAATLACCLLAAGCTVDNPLYVGTRVAAVQDLATAPDLTPRVDLADTPDLTVLDWLSDHAWTSGQSGWGPIEKDRSNGEAVGGDGRVLTIHGVTYAKGFGVHANAEIRFALDRGYQGLTVGVGVDDETRGLGSVVFQIFVDGIKQYDSGLCRGGEAPRVANVNLAGAGDLRLVVNDGGDGNNGDHADWAGARLLR